VNLNLLKCFEFPAAAPQTGSLFGATSQPSTFGTQTSGFPAFGTQNQVYNCIKTTSQFWNFMSYKIAPFIAVLYSWNFHKDAVFS
jgi:hypothetical protein